VFRAIAGSRRGLRLGEVAAKAKGVAVSQGNHRALSNTLEETSATVTLPWRARGIPGSQQFSSTHADNQDTPELRETPH
jgi:hypothetical protein